MKLGNSWKTHEMAERFDICACLGNYVDAFLSGNLDNIKDSLVWNYTNVYLVSAHSRSRMLFVTTMHPRP